MGETQQFPPQKRRIKGDQQALTKTATILEPFNINSNLGQINSKVFDYNVGVAQSFKFPNAYKADKKLLNQNVALAKSYEAVTKTELIRNVSNAYYNWLYSNQYYKLLLQTDSIYADYEKYADKKFKVGESNKLEKINASLQRQDLKLQLQQANTQMAVYYSELQRWIQSNDTYQAPVIYTSLPPINLSDSALIKNHPVLQYMQQQVVVKELAINTEKAKSNRLLM